MEPIKHSTLSKPIYNTLKSMILSQELKPGEKIIQEKIALQLGVSRTPLMKALQSLEHELLIESIPRRGMYVKEVSLKEMIDIYYCREGIECMAIRLATERSDKSERDSIAKIFQPFTTSKKKIDGDEYKKADENFHSSIMELSKNPVLIKMARLSQVHNQVYHLGLLRRPEETLVEHIKIIVALMNGDVDRAENEMRNHIASSRKVLENLINKNDNQLTSNEDL